MAVSALLPPAQLVLALHRVVRLPLAALRARARLALPLLAVHRPVRLAMEAVLPAVLPAVLQ
jgi:hypothetical protein